jgi:multiple sugar transport system ATP-binding protein
MSTYPDAVATGKVDVVEHMGSELYVHMQLGGQNVIARINSRSDVHYGDQIKVAFDMNKSHIFNAETEEAVMFHN